MRIQWIVSATYALFHSCSSAFSRSIKIGVSFCVVAPYHYCESCDCSLASLHCPLFRMPPGCMYPNLNGLHRLCRSPIPVRATKYRAQDYDVLAARARLTSFFLYKAGVAAIFGPGTPVAYSAKVVMQLLMQE